MDEWWSSLNHMSLGMNTGTVLDAHYGSGLAVKDPDGLAREIFAAPEA